MNTELPTPLALAIDDVINAGREFARARDVLDAAERKYHHAVGRLTAARSEYVTVDPATGKWSVAPAR